MIKDGEVKSSLRSVWSLVKKACAVYSERTAIEYGDEKVLYKDLTKNVEKARAVIERNRVEPGAVVAVIADSSPGAISSALAIWASKCTLMLIDASLPEERKRAMLASVPTAAVIRFSDSGLELETLDSERESEEDILRSNQDFAYIAFTSGSTGKPKAIIGSHKGLANFVSWQQREFNIGQDDRFAQFTSLSFDVWFRDVFTPLISGSTVCIPTKRPMGSEASLSFLRDQNITAVHLVPSIAALWIRSGASIGTVDSLRYAFFAGEPLESSLVTHWVKVFPRMQAVNFYGPTETTLAKHFKIIPPSPENGIQSVGKAIDGTVSFIVSEDGSLASEGEVGEVCIASRDRSHGYFENGALVSPFQQSAWPKLTNNEVYRTGDIGRLVNGDEIELLGRQDEQIKVNGVRIDLAEIRSLLLGVDGVSNSFVCAKNTKFTKAIVAFVESESCDKDALYKYLRQHLPLVMLPSEIRISPDLPKLANGKVDRKTLARLATESEEQEDPPQQTDSLAGRKVADIWCDILGRQNVNHRKSFFDLGGNSLSIVVLHERIQSEFRIGLPLVKLFEHPTVKAQVELVERLSGAPGSDSGTDTHSSVVSERLARRQRVIASQRRRVNRRETQTGVHGYSS